MKRPIILLSLALLMLVTACGGGTPPAFRNAQASGYYSPEIIQCVPYAREKSGLRIFGDADGWWRKSKGLYLQGNEPKRGAVLVLKKTRRMRSGHVAVVKDIVSRRQINVTHSNWGNDSRTRHIIYESQRAEDVSPRGDWSQVRFWNYEKNVFGAPYAAYGFIYP